jgi:hypothetical protein
MRYQVVARKHDYEVILKETDEYKVALAFKLAVMKCQENAGYETIIKET